MCALQAGREFHAARTRFCSLTERVADILAARGPYDDTDYSLPACFMRMQVRSTAGPISVRWWCVCVQDLGMRACVAGTV
jgi:hypothetical protein